MLLYCPCLIVLVISKSIAVLTCEREEESVESESKESEPDYSEEELEEEQEKDTGELEEEKTIDEDIDIVKTDNDIF